MENKYSSIYYLKTIAILAVVVGHCATPLTGFIFSWHMPMFFFITGLTLNVERSLTDTLKRDSKRLLIPYVGFAFLGFGAELLKRYVLGRQQLTIVNEIYGIVFWMDMHTLNHYGFVLWFLPALFSARFFIIYLIKIIKYSWIVLGISLGVGLAFVNRGFILPFALDKAFVGAMWLTVGFIIGTKAVPLFNSSREIMHFIAPIVLVISGLLVIFLEKPGINLASKTLVPLYYSLFFSCLAILFISLIAVQLSRIPLGKGWQERIRFIADNTMIIYVLHVYTNNIAFIISQKLDSNWIIHVTLSIVLVIILLIIYRYAMTVVKTWYKKFKFHHS